MRNDRIEGNGQGTYVALDTSNATGIWDHPPRREAQGDGAAIVLSARESRVHGEGRQVSKKPIWRGTRDAKCRNHSGNHDGSDTGEPSTPKGVSSVRRGAEGKVPTRQLACRLPYCFGTLDRAEERDQRTVLLLMQEVEVAARPHRSWGTISEIQPE